MHMIEKALRTNYVTFYDGNITKLAASDYEPRICAIEEEHAVMLTAKLVNNYRASVMKRVNEIKKMTDSNELHQALMPKAASTSSIFDKLKADRDDNRSKSCDSCDSGSPVSKKMQGSRGSPKMQKSITTFFTSARNLLKPGSISPRSPRSVSPKGEGYHQITNFFKMTKSGKQSSSCSDQEYNDRVDSASSDLTNGFHDKSVKTEGASPEMIDTSVFVKSSEHSDISEIKPETDLIQVKQESENTVLPGQKPDVSNSIDNKSTSDVIDALIMPKKDVPKIVYFFEKKDDSG